MRRGERYVWDQIANAARKVAASSNYAEEYMAKVALREAWAKLNSIDGVQGIPKSRPDL